MDLGDLLFLGVLLASGVASVIGAKKKKAAAAGPLSKRPRVLPSTALPPTIDTGLRETMPPPPKARVAPTMQATRAPIAGMGVGPVAAKNRSPRPKRRHWREYLIMKEVLGPPVSMRRVNEDSDY
jgi:hypothetical protein